MNRLQQYFDFTVVWQHRGLILEGLLTTVQLTVLIFVISILPAIAVALARRFGPGWLQRLLGAVVNVARSVPTVLSVVFVYLALPFVGVTLSAFASVLLALSVMQVVYFSEVIRGALAAVAPGQYAAARALGLSPIVMLVKVILPQAAIVAAPPFVSAVVLMLQHTSISSAIALNDLITSALSIQNMTGQASPIVAAGVCYVLLALPLVRLTRRWERARAHAR
ncbi:amino acid ABC transporter permease [Acuticoccus sediminis]|uniref:amino acid ABC transporter permease n=1 Tax=Acuticoccus sediminis TaxID=2184697 RepID=UPI001CFED25E|nr:ABC transporter permease subunit [Acuticoccus sediminis]